MRKIKNPHLQRPYLLGEGTDNKHVSGVQESFLEEVAFELRLQEEEGVRWESWNGGGEGQWWHRSLEKRIPPEAGTGVTEDEAQAVATGVESLLVMETIRAQLERAERRMVGEAVGTVSADHCLKEFAVRRRSRWRSYGAKGKPLRDETIKAKGCSGERGKLLMHRVPEGRGGSLRGGGGMAGEPSMRAGGGHGQCWPLCPLSSMDTASARGHVEQEEGAIWGQARRCKTISWARGKVSLLGEGGRLGESTVHPSSSVLEVRMDSVSMECLLVAPVTPPRSLTAKVCPVHSSHHRLLSVL